LRRIGQQPSAQGQSAVASTLPTLCYHSDVRPAYTVAFARGLMPKRRKKAAPAAAKPSAAVAAAPSTGSRRELDILVLVAALLCIVVAYLNRRALNPDGVSYLDLAAALKRGDWFHFVQGYWSPLFPAITAGLGRLLSLSGPQLVIITHVINLVAAFGALTVLWIWARRSESPFRGRAAFAIFMIGSWGLPRIEAVTPDVMLFATMVWLGYELLVHGGRRWLLVGALLGVAFLVKTSAWPWLIVAVAVRLWAAGDPGSRRRVVWSALVCMLVMLTWIVPMSRKAGHLTLGSSGRLNYEWYIHANTSRLPDTDTGENAAYRAVKVSDDQYVTVATFDDPTWTYQPWGDPTAWRDKVLSDTGTTPTVLQLTGYWLRNAGLVFGLWLLPVLLFVLAPVTLLRYRTGVIHELLTSERNALVAIALGMTGLLQFIAVHAEPRLFAPFGMLLAMGWIAWMEAAPSDRNLVKSPRVASVLMWAGVVCALAFAVPKMVASVSTNTRLNGTVAQVIDLERKLSAAGTSIREVAVIGPAAPFMGAAYWIGARIAMQIPPRSLPVLTGLPATETHDLMLTIFSGKVSVVWQTSSDGGMRMLVVPPPK
jgi:hypothetical protein